MTQRRFPLRPFGAFVATTLTMVGCDRSPSPGAASTSQTQPTTDAARFPGDVGFPATGPAGLTPADLQSLTRRATEVGKLSESLVVRREHFDQNVKRILSAREPLLRALSDGTLKDAELPRRWHEFAASVGAGPTPEAGGSDAAGPDAASSADATIGSPGFIADTIDPATVRLRIRSIEFNLLGGRPTLGDVQFIEEQETGLKAAHQSLDASEKTTRDLIARLNTEFPDLKLQDANAPPPAPLSADEVVRLRETVNRWQARRIELSGQVGEYRQNRREWLAKMQRRAADDPQAKAALDAVQADDLAERWTALLSRLYGMDRNFGGDLFPDDAKAVRVFDADLDAFQKALAEQRQIMREWNVKS